MIMNYINKIKANITIYASKKTSNLLDGAYTSIYKGRSMDFDDLREYVAGDDVKDIDWKSSARTGSILIRRYIAEKKHNILLVLDSGKKMIADTESLESKKEVSLMSAGTIAYLAHKHGDFVGVIYNKDSSITFNPFKSGLYNIERILCNYEKDIECNNLSNIETVLEDVSRTIKRKTIIFVITDLSGMESVQDNVLKKLSMQHDVMFVNISDAYMTGENSYDVDSNLYIPKMFLKDSKLFELEKQIKEETYLSCAEKFKKYKISTTTINSTNEITAKIIDLLERHRYANLH